MNHVRNWWAQNRHGLILAGAVGLAALGMAHLEGAIWGREPLEALVLAILLGMVVRSFWTPPQKYVAGVHFAAKPLLEIAVVLLGASINGEALVQAGPSLAAAVVVLVVSGIAVGTLLGRAFGLPPKLATLVACGNAICGNSAIASLAPVIEAEEEHVAASIAFTAILGIGVVLLLPMAVSLLGFSAAQGGVLAGLTVYAVPQVLAATSGAGVAAVQIGTLVKLTRVLMLGPVVFFFALRQKRQSTPIANAPRADWKQFVPPFIIGFVLLSGARTVGAIGTPGAAVLREAANWLTIIAMAGLGLLADIRVVRDAGRPVLLTALLSLAAIGALSVALIRVLHL